MEFIYAHAREDRDFLLDLLEKEEIIFIIKGYIETINNKLNSKSGIKYGGIQYIKRDIDLMAVLFGEIKLDLIELEKYCELIYDEEIDA